MTPWFIVPKPASPQTQVRCRLFCFPHSGAGASTFRAWPSHLPSELEVCAVQLPGRESRLHERPFTQLSAAVAALAEILQPYFGIPFAFFGHSLGALMSFELARQLRQQKRSGPLYLFLSGHRAPQLRDREEPIHQLSDPDLIDEVCRRYNGIPDEVRRNRDLVDIILPTLRADFSANETYVYKEEKPLDCPISCFGGLQDTSATHEELVAWKEHTTRSFQVTMFPGNHFYIHDARVALLKAIAGDLKEDPQ